MRFKDLSVTDDRLGFDYGAFDLATGKTNFATLVGTYFSVSDIPAYLRGRVAFKIE